MDLVSGVKRVVVLMEHNAKDGSPKIKTECDLPLTGKQVVDLIITDLCVFEVEKGQGLTLIELNDGVSLDDVKAKTGCAFSGGPGSCKPVRSASRRLLPAGQQRRALPDSYSISAGSGSGKRMPRDVFARRPASAIPAASRNGR